MSWKIDDGAQSRERQWKMLRTELKVAGLKKMMLSLSVPELSASRITNELSLLDHEVKQMLKEPKRETKQIVTKHDEVAVRNLYEHLQSN